MSADLIDVHTDNSQAVIDRATKELSHKGVLLFDQDETLESISVTYQGLSNKRKATQSLPLERLKDLSEEQIDQKVNDIVTSISDKIRQGGESG